MELWTAFLLGLVGSLHCAGMCGPLLLALARSQPAARRPTIGRMAYHFGRVSSYCVLGAMLGLLGHLVAPVGFQRWLSLTLGIALLAGLLLSSKMQFAMPMASWLGWLKNSMRGLLQSNSLLSQAVMGALNGLLPCGLVYVAAAGATATAYPLSGAAYMALFGLGTWPMMLAIHFAGHRLPLPARFPIGSVTRAAVLLMAMLLLLRGLELGIPFLSPSLSATAHHEGGRCH
jgi:sulfite exporter TauE/SafE